VQCSAVIHGSIDQVTTNVPPSEKLSDIKPSLVLSLSLYVRVRVRVRALYSRVVPVACQQLEEAVRSEAIAKHIAVRIDEALHHSALRAVAVLQGNNRLIQERPISAGQKVPAPVNIGVKRLRLRFEGQLENRNNGSETRRNPTVFVRIEPFQGSNERSEISDHPARISEA
jgi:hypothetical protein